MRIAKILALMLVASAISLIAGSTLLSIYNLVPLYLIEITGVAILVLLVLASYVNKANLWAINIATLLGIVAPLFSISTPAHVAVLSSLGQGLLISLLGVLQLLGFFIFPIAYLVLRIVYRNQLAGKALAKSLAKQ